MRISVPTENTSFTQANIELLHRLFGERSDVHISELCVPAADPQLPAIMLCGYDKATDTLSIDHPYSL